MATLVLGPILRHVGSGAATIWLEADAPCVVSILGHHSRTFHVHGHHYAVVIAGGLSSPGTYPYDVALDGKVVWGGERSIFPPSTIRTLASTAPLTLAFGSCRVTAPDDGPSSGSRTVACGADALRALAAEMRRKPPASWPDALLLLGDQVYADDPPPQTRRFLRGRRDTSGPHGEEVSDFEEYARLYREAWQEPSVRWLFSTVGTMMLWDDHDIHDDWNISNAWRERLRATDWWPERLIGGIMSYWIYQHLGNLTPDELDADELLAAVRAAEDAEPLLRAFAERAAQSPTSVRWSVCRDFGRTRFLALDCRGGRVLTPGQRAMLSDEQWRWVEHHARGDFDHLLIGLSDPYLSPPAIHHMEAISEAVCDGAWGRTTAQLGEWIRETCDLDHWPAFAASFERLTALLRDVASGRHGPPPATIAVLAGDVHNCYLSRAEFAEPIPGHCPVYQVVCSPLRNPLGAAERLAIRLLRSRVAGCAAAGLAAAARLSPPPVRGRYVAGPWFDNQIGFLELSGRQAAVRFERAVQQDRRDPPALQLVGEYPLTAAAARH